MGVATPRSVRRATDRPLPSSKSTTIGPADSDRSLTKGIATSLTKLSDATA